MERRRTGDRAFAGRGVESNHIGQGQLLCLGSFHDCCRQRMFARALKAGYELQQVVFVDAGLGNGGVQWQIRVKTMKETRYCPESISTEGSMPARR